MYLVQRIDLECKLTHSTIILVYTFSASNCITVASPKHNFGTFLRESLYCIIFLSKELSKYRQIMIYHTHLNEDYDDKYLNYFINNNR